MDPGILFSGSVYALEQTAHIGMAAVSSHFVSVRHISGPKNTWEHRVGSWISAGCQV